MIDFFPPFFGRLLLILTLLPLPLSFRPLALAAPPPALEPPNVLLPRLPLLPFPAAPVLPPPFAFFPFPLLAAAALSMFTVWCGLVREVGWYRTSGRLVVGTNGRLVRMVGWYEWIV